MPPVCEFPGVQRVTDHETRVESGQSRPFRVIPKPGRFFGEEPAAFRNKIR